MNTQNLIQQMGSLAIQIQQSEQRTAELKKQYDALNAQASYLQQLEQQGFEIKKTDTEKQTEKPED